MLVVPQRRRDFHLSARTHGTCKCSPVPASGDSPVPDACNTKREVFPRTLDIRVHLGMAGCPAQTAKAPLLSLWAACKVEASISDHTSKVGLCRKALDRLDQILVRVAIAREDLADGWDDFEGILTICSAMRKKRRGKGREL